MMIASTLIAATLTHWAAPALSNEMRLPDREPTDGEKGKAVAAVRTEKASRNQIAYAAQGLGRHGRYARAGGVFVRGHDVVACERCLSLLTEIDFTPIKQV